MLDRALHKIINVTLMIVIACRIILCRTRRKFFFKSILIYISIVSIVFLSHLSRINRFLKNRQRREKLNHRAEGKRRRKVWNRFISKIIHVK